MLMRRSPRRVSRRTRRRYSAIRRFFRRALGTLSRSSNSVLSESNYTVTDLKHRIIDLEQKLSEVSKRYPNLSLSTGKDSPRTDIPTTRTVTSLISSKDKNDGIKKIHNSTFSISSCGKKPLKAVSNRCKTHEDKQYSDTSTGFFPRKSKKDKHINNTVFNCENTSTITPLQSKNTTPMFLSSSYVDQKQKISTGKEKKKSKHHQNKKNSDEKTIDIPGDFALDINTKYNLDSYGSNKSRERKFKPLSPRREEKIESKIQKRTKIPKQKGDQNDLPELDKTFISDIIRKQYRPIRLGRRKSEISQFSVPVCRDRVSSKDISPCRLGHPHQCVCEENKVNELRSIYDTKMCKCSSPTRPKYKSKHPQLYNDSALYDLVPVKEKPESPSRRRSMMLEENQSGKPYREVPPSPRSQRPRLNLTANYSDYEQVQDLKADDKSHTADRFNSLVTKLNLANLSNEPLENTVLDSTQVVKSDVFNKTEETLLEIKETLQQFLNDFKKENSTHNLQDNTFAGVSSNCYLNNYPYNPGNAMPPMLPTSCYYPMAMPMCPLNCIPNTYTAANNFQNSTSKENIGKEQDDNENKSDRDNTVELIKEIYKCVTNKLEFEEKCNLEPSKLENQYQKIEPEILNPKIELESLNPKIELENQNPKIKLENQNPKIESASQNPRDQPTNQKPKIEPENQNPKIEPAPQNPKDQPANQKPKIELENQKSDESDKILTSRSVGSSKISLYEDNNNQYNNQSIYRSSSYGTINTKITANLYEDLSKAIYYSDAHLNISETDDAQQKEISSSTIVCKKKPKKNTFRKILKSFNFMTNKKEKVVSDDVSKESVVYNTNVSTVSLKAVPQSQAVAHYPPYNQTYVARHPSQTYYQEHSYPYAVNSSYSEGGMSSMHSYIRPTAPPYALSFAPNGKPASVVMRTKQIELKCAATQSDSDTVPFYQKMAKLFQPPKPTVANKADISNNITSHPKPSVTAPANFTSLPPISQVPGPDKQLFDWKKLQSKLIPPDFDLKTMAHMQKENLMFQQTNEKLQNQLLKKFGQTSKNPLSMKNILRKALLNSAKPDQRMLYAGKPKFFF